MNSSDTSLEVQRKYDQLWQALSPEERFLRGLELVRFSHQMLLEGFRSRFPDLSKDELRSKVMERIYGI